jgi:hypothetical protein
VAQNKSKSKRAAGKVTLKSLHSRVGKLEKHVAALQESDGRSLTFTLNANNAPKIVQLTLQDTGEELVITPNSPSNSSKPRQSGQQIPVGINTWGDPGQRAVIDVTNVTKATTPIVTSALTGSSASDAAMIETGW